MTFVLDRPLMHVVQVLAALVDVRVHQAAGCPIALMRLLMNIVILIHNKGRIVARNAAAAALDSRFTKGLLESTADLDVPDASGRRRAALANLISRLASGRRAIGSDSSIRPHAAPAHRILASQRSTIRMRRCPLPRAARTHLLKRLDIP